TKRHPKPNPKCGRPPPPTRTKAVAGAVPKDAQQSNGSVRRRALPVNRGDDAGAPGVSCVFVHRVNRVVFSALRPYFDAPFFATLFLAFAIASATGSPSSGSVAALPRHSA